MYVNEKIKDLLACCLSLCLTQRVRAFLCHEPHFRIWEKRGIHITPVHYYQPIPDTRTLNDPLWEKQSDLVGIDMNENGQIGLISQFSSRYRREYQALPLEKTRDLLQFFINNGTFESVDSEILYCMIRHLRPKTIIEIGSGYSTLLSAKAMLTNKQESGVDTQLISIDPYPNVITETGVPGLSKLIQKKLEEVDLLLFSELERDDILFIDSSHILRIANDVQRLYLEIIPKLNRGVHIHIHDIFLPAEYPKEVVLKRLRFWTEQYLLQAFLAFNHSFEVMWGSSFMHLKHPEKLETAFPSYKRSERWPGSLWVRKVK
jgi:predicted O-methyltransferase YrrM